MIGQRVASQFSASAEKRCDPRESRVPNAASHSRHRHHRGLSDQHGVDRLLGFASRLAEHAGLLPGRQQDALVCAGHLQRLGHVRHQRHHAAGLLDVHLRLEERVDSLAVAHLQPDLPHGLPLRMAAPLQGHDRGGVDQDALRHRSGRAVVAPDRGVLRLRQHHRLLQLRIQRHRQVCGDFSAMASLAQPVRADPDCHYGDLRDQGRHDQRGHHRGGAILHSGHCFLCSGHHRHAQGGAGDAAQDGARRLGQPLLRLALESELVDVDSGSQFEDCRGRLRTVWLLRHDAVLQGRADLGGRPRAELRYAARALVENSARSFDDERLGQHRAHLPALLSYHRTHGSCGRVLLRLHQLHGHQHGLRTGAALRHSGGSCRWDCWDS